MKTNKTEANKVEATTAVVSSELVRRLVQKYEKRRAKFYRWALIATRKKDVDAQLIYATYQTAYTEMQVDLEKLMPPNDKLTDAGQKTL